jgi:glutamate synthase (ferredoxin)
MEYHSNNGDLSKLLHKAVGLGGTGANPEAFKAYTEYLANAPVTTLRDVLEVKSDREPIALEQVRSLC